MAGQHERNGLFSIFAELRANFQARRAIREDVQNRKLEIFSIAVNAIQSDGNTRAQFTRDSIEYMLDFFSEIPAEAQDNLFNEHAKIVEELQGKVTKGTASEAERIRLEMESRVVNGMTQLIEDRDKATD